MALFFDVIITFPVMVLQHFDTGSMVRNYEAYKISFQLCFQLDVRILVKSFSSKPLFESEAQEIVATVHRELDDSAIFSIYWSYHKRNEAERCVGERGRRHLHPYILLFEKVMI